ncbi:MAG TPA: heparan-alpha-glucosaminide N-acetyltransferase domain-containing protein [Puia sp.]|nr:heparan-alpha-glucosaminide N-acetyltransferase domain-containing protein [Puia sp.]
MKRIKSLDLARGFTVLMIAPIHTMMVYSKLDIRETLLGKLFAFIAEGPGAQLFMMLMGIFFAMSPPKNFLAVCKRTFYLLLAAYLLNLFKFVFPYTAGFLPNDLLKELQIQNGTAGYGQLILLGDILHFAALAQLVLFSIQRLKNYHIIAIILAAVYCLLSPLFWDLHNGNPVLDYLMQLSGGAPPRIFFPLFPWIVYPLTGLFIGHYFKKGSLQKIFWYIRDIGWILIITSCLIKYSFKMESEQSFYRTYPGDTMIHLGIVLVWISCWEWIQENVKENLFFRVLRFMSRHITTIYITEWIIIFWLLPIFGYQKLDMLQTICCLILTSSLTMIFVFLINPKSKGHSINIE